MPASNEPHAPKLRERNIAAIYVALFSIGIILGALAVFRWEQPLAAFVIGLGCGLTFVRMIDFWQ